MIKKFRRFLIDYYLGRLVKYLNRTYYCHGNPQKLHLGESVSAVNTLFNVSSGHIWVGDNTIFGHNVMILTGIHRLLNGRREKLVTGKPDAPPEGYDIKIGQGCWIASGVTIIGQVNIGDNSIIGAGSVVTKSIPSGVFAAGVPCKVIKDVLKKTPNLYK